jgi:TctA family transporter
VSSRGFYFVSIAAFMAYSVARQRAKKGDCFGEGEVKGIAAPEAAKTASISGSMVLLLSLGIPGDSVTAVMIGAFILHGVQNTCERTRKRHFMRYYLTYRKRLSSSAKATIGHLRLI